MKETSITDFTGTYTTLDVDPNTSGDDKADYYPNPDRVVVKLGVETGHQSGNPLNQHKEDVIRGKVILGADTWRGAAEFENARFYFRAGMLVSDPILTNVSKPRALPNDKIEYLHVTELVELNGVELVVTLLWSDGDFGTWRCR